MKESRRIRLLMWMLLVELILWSCIKTDLIIPREHLLIFKKKPIPAAVPAYNELKKFSFEDKNALTGWEEKVFKGKSAYTLTEEAGESFLRADSQNASSGLYQKMDFEVTPDLLIRWQWRARVFPVKKEMKLSNRREDDFAARIYVIFPGSNFFNTNVIEYIWDEHLPVGSVSASPFSDRIQLFVVRSGAPAAATEWASETRNVFEDYKKFFGKNPDRHLGAVAIMSDSDNTGTNSAADFKWIELSKQKPLAETKQ